MYASLTSPTAMPTQIVVMGIIHGNLWTDSHDFWIAAFSMFLFWGANKITGHTVYNILKISEVECDEDERPLQPPVIQSCEVCTVNMAVPTNQHMTCEGERGGGSSVPCVICFKFDNMIRT